MPTDRDRLIDDGLDVLREVTVPTGDWDAYRKANPAEPRRRRTILGVIDNVKAKLARITIDLADATARRVPTLAGWGKDFRRLIGAGHVAGAMAGIGTTQPTPADMDVVEKNIRGQSIFFKGFRQAIATGALLLPPSPGTLAARAPGVPVAASVLSRAEMYADAIWGGTAGVLRSRMIRDGFDQERRILGGIENACPECPPLTREGIAIVGGRSILVGPDGWTPIGQLPGIGETICRVRCRCHFEYRHAKSSTVMIPVKGAPQPGNVEPEAIPETVATPVVTPPVSSTPRKKAPATPAEPIKPKPLPPKDKPVAGPEGSGLAFAASDRSRRDKDRMVWIDVAKLDASWAEDVSYYLSPGGEGPSAIPGRYGLARAFVDKAKDQAIPFEMPQVTVSASGQVSFLDGRHRFAALRDAGLTRIPIAVEPQAAARMADLYGTKPPKKRRPKP